MFKNQGFFSFANILSGLDRIIIIHESIHVHMTCLKWRKLGLFHVITWRFQLHKKIKKPFKCKTFNSNVDNIK